jgi:hypothetical protein
MLVYALTEPVDIFDGLTPLPQWIAENPVLHTRWALQAVLALADVAGQVRWSGDMRHLPSVGVTLTPPGTSPYLVVKQDNNGTTFVVADTSCNWPMRMSTTGFSSTLARLMPGLIPRSPMFKPQTPITSE